LLGVRPGGHRGVGQEAGAARAGQRRRVGEGDEHARAEVVAVVPVVKIDGGPRAGGPVQAGRGARDVQGQVAAGALGEVDRGGPADVAAAQGDGRDTFGGGRGGAADQRKGAAVQG